ncbi:Ribosome maturation factor RimP [Bienertia sinuspersici]
MATATAPTAAAAMQRPLYFCGCCTTSPNFTITNNHHRQPHQHRIAKLKLSFGKLDLGSIGTTRIQNKRSHQFAPECRKFGHTVRCKAMEQSTSPSVYQGVYGPWTIDSSDIREVVLYRSGLVMAAVSFVLASSTSFLPSDSPLSNTLGQNIDLLYLLGSAGLGMSLYLIHIYVTEIKRTLQALWALGVVGSLVTYTAFAQPAGEGLVQYVVDHPTAVWLVGPVFASLTGLVFKEGLCYGKLEAALLTFIIPASLLGHLTGIMDDVAKLSLLGFWMALFTIFAARKFTQPVKDDIGDKSVFMFNALPEEEKAALVQKLQQQKF